jgi:MFS family permease
MEEIALDHDDYTRLAGKWGPYQRIISAIFILTIMHIPLVVLILPMMQKTSQFTFNNSPVDREIFCTEVYYTQDWDLLSPHIQITSELNNWASDLKIVCETKKVFSLVGTIYFIASIAGYLAMSKFPDRYGRRTVFLCLNFFSLISLIQMLFLYNYSQILIAAFVLGLSSINLALGSVIVNENIDGNYTALVIGLSMAMFPLGGIINTVLMYLFCDWRYYHILIIILVTINNYLGFKYLKESPKWLIANHKYEEYLETIVYISELNGTFDRTWAFIEAKHFSHHNNEKNQVALKNNSLSGIENFRHVIYEITDLLKYKSIRLMTLFNLYLWIFSGFSFYGILLNLEGLTGNIYIDSFVSYTAEFMAEIASGILADRFGRKTTIFWSIVLSTLGGALFPLSDSLWISVPALFIMCIGVASVFNVLYIYSAEMYPTNIKSLAVGIFFIFNRLAAGIVPYILTLMQNVVFIIFLFSCGALFVITFMPETLNLDFGHEVMEVKDGMYEKNSKNKSRTSSTTDYISLDENSF